MAATITTPDGIMEDSNLFALNSYNYSSVKKKVIQVYTHHI